jgi:hypothetical protein
MIKLMQPQLMHYEVEELILLAVNGLRMDLEAAVQVKALC